MSKLVLMGAPPLTGKSSIRPFLGEMLRHGDAPNWLALDNELNGFSMQMRIAFAKASGLALNSPDFVRAVNLPGQLAYQASARDFASQGFNVLMTGPFEDLTPDVPSADGGTKPLLKKMIEEDFGACDFRALHVVLWPDNEETYTADDVITAAGWGDVEAEVQKRRAGRFDKEDGPQALLDADKGDDDYYRRRVEMVLRTHEMFGTPLVKLSVSDSPQDAAQKVYEAIRQTYATAA